MDDAFLFILNYFDCKFTFENEAIWESYFKPCTLYKYCTTFFNKWLANSLLSLDAIVAF